LRFGRCAAPDVSASDDYRHLDAHIMCLAYLLSKIINRGRLNAVAPGAF
jgi:hypothetical protein